MVVVVVSFQQTRSKNQELGTITLTFNPFELTSLFKYYMQIVFGGFIAAEEGPTHENEAAAAPDRRFRPSSTRRDGRPCEGRSWCSEAIAGW